MSDGNEEQADRGLRWRLLRGGNWSGWGIFGGPRPAFSGDADARTLGYRSGCIGFRLALRGAGSGSAPIQKKE